MNVTSKKGCSYNYQTINSFEVKNRYSVKYDPTLPSLQSPKVDFAIIFSPREESIRVVINLFKLKNRSILLTRLLQPKVSPLLRHAEFCKIQFYKWSSWEPTLEWSIHTSDFLNYCMNFNYWVNDFLCSHLLCVVLQFSHYLNWNRITNCTRMGTQPILELHVIVEKIASVNAPIP